MSDITQKQTFQKELETTPFKRQVIYENNEMILDSATGEIRQIKTQQKIKTTSEPDFIKVYYKAMLAVQGIDGLSLEFVLALSSVITYSNNPKSPVYFHNNSTNRQIIAECCLNKKGQPISDNMVARHINAAVKVGLLFKTVHRGTYEVNPCMIARGKWENIKGLQANFDFYNGKWVRHITEEIPQAKVTVPEIQAAEETL